MLAVCLLGWVVFLTAPFVIQARLSASFNGSVSPFVRLSDTPEALAVWKRQATDSSTRVRLNQLPRPVRRSSYSVEQQTALVNSGVHTPEITPKLVDGASQSTDAAELAIRRDSFVGYREKHGTPYANAVQHVWGRPPVGLAEKRRVRRSGRGGGSHGRGRGSRKRQREPSPPAPRQEANEAPVAGPSRRTDDDEGFSMLKELIDREETPPRKMARPSSPSASQGRKSPVEEIRERMERLNRGDTPPRSAAGGTPRGGSPPRSGSGNSPKGDQSRRACKRDSTGLCAPTSLPGASKPVGGASAVQRLDPGGAGGRGRAAGGSSGGPNTPKGGSRGQAAPHAGGSQPQNPSSGASGGKPGGSAAGKQFGTGNDKWVKKRWFAGGAQSDFKTSYNAKTNTAYNKQAGIGYHPFKSSQTSGQTSGTGNNLFSRIRAAKTHSQATSLRAGSRMHSLSGGGLQPMQKAAPRGGRPVQGGRQGGVRPASTNGGRSPVQNPAGGGRPTMHRPLGGGQQRPSSGGQQGPAGGGHPPMRTPTGGRRSPVRGPTGGGRLRMQASEGGRRPPVQGPMGGGRSPLQRQTGGGRPPMQGPMGGGRPPMQGPMGGGQGPPRGGRPPMQGQMRGGRPPMQGSPGRGQGPPGGGRPPPQQGPAGGAHGGRGRG